MRRRHRRSFCKCLPRDSLPERGRGEGRAGGVGLGTEDVRLLIPLGGEKVVGDAGGERDMLISVPAGSGQARTRGTGEESHGSEPEKSNLSQSLVNSGDLEKGDKRSSGEDPCSCSSRHSLHRTSSASVEGERLNGGEPIKRPRSGGAKLKSQRVRQPVVPTGNQLPTHCARGSSPPHLSFLACCSDADSA